MRLGESIKNWVRLTYAFRVLNTLRQRGRYRKWLLSGEQGPPPPPAKHQLIREYAGRFHTPIFVETGTFLGDTVNAVLGNFEKLISIELSETLFRKAERRFGRTPQVTLYQGDSGEVLARILPTIGRPTLFWLDAHFSEGVTVQGVTGTPLYSEVDMILRHPQALQHVILIDDARLLTGRNGYPSIEALQERVTVAGLTSCEVKNDIVRISARPL